MASTQGRQIMQCCTKSQVQKDMMQCCTSRKSGEQKKETIQNKVQGAKSQADNAVLHKGIQSTS